MDTPGYDPPCTTGLVAGGANVLVFTTGRGSVLGLKPTPCIKVATNTPMYERMIDDMDLDAGTILEGEPVEDVGRRIFELILDVAGGKQTKSEQHGVGEEEFAPWQHRADPVSRPGQAGRPRRSAARRSTPLGRSGWLLLAGAGRAGLARLVPGRAAAQRREPGGPRSAAGCSCARRFPRSCPGSTFRESLPRPGARRAEPRREPAPAAADRRWPPALIAAAALGAGRADPARRWGSAATLDRAASGSPLAFGLGTSGARGR